MKKINLILLAALTVATFACKKKKEDNVDPGETTVDASTVILKGELCDMKLDASKKYLLKGTVFVNDGCKLTIPAGTVIMGDKATKGCLLINTGGKIDARGTAAKPIIFTSALPAGARDEGDWCGVILLGKATVNQVSPTIEGITPGVTYGGSDDADNSGIMQYCRIEFAGIALTPNNETNGLTFGGVGNGTTIDHIQSSYGGDDSFEWFGGSVECTHMVAFASWDDDFDTDFGFHGKVQFGLALRDAYQADNSGSNGFESDNDAAGDANTPKTAVVFSNMTLIGPVGDTTKPISTNHKNAAHIRRNSAMSLYNSIMVGYAGGVLIDGGTGVNTTEYNFSTSPVAFLKGNTLILAKYNKTTAPNYLLTAGGSAAATVASIWNANNYPNTLSTSTTASGNNTAYYAALSAAGISSDLFVMNQGGGVTYPSNPNFAVSSGTLLTTVATNPSAITTVSYSGAFDGTDWTDSWGEFDPKNKKY